MPETVEQALASICEKPARGAQGRFLPDNVAALKSGSRSRQLGNALEPARREIAARTIAGLGDDADDLSEPLSRLVEAFSEATLLRRSVFLQMAGRPTSAKGKARALLGAYLQLIDRELRLAQAIGLERRARRVPSLADVMGEPRG